MKFINPVIIGLEIHVELDTKTKLFCSCNAQGSDEPNTRTCPVCLGMPGSKPVANKKAIEYGIKIAKAFNCKLAEKVIFSRKSYFYPDMAKNYQITQYEWPIGENGFAILGNNNIGIKRIHLEEDPASLVHPGGIENSPYVLVDYNRSGNPLCEIVTEPQLSSPQEARDFMKSLITVLRYLNVFDPAHNIVKADANVSIKESGYVRAEIKNISGFKEIERALTYEIERQRQQVKDGHKLSQETRAWKIQEGISTLLRKKETEEDYGYIFDPDLVPIDITKEMLKKINSEIPELPDVKAKRYVKEFKLSVEDANVLVSEYELTSIFEKAIKKVDPVLAARWIRRELVRVLNYNKTEISDMKINDGEFIKLLEMIDKNKITEKVGQKIIEKLAVEDIEVEKFIRQHDMAGVADTNEIEKFCKEAIIENQKAADDYRSGKEEALNFLLGAVMRKAKGKADPVEVKNILKNIIRSL